MSLLKTLILLLTSKGYDKKYLTGRWFENYSSMGYKWCKMCFFHQKILGINNAPWPVGVNTTIGDWRNIEFHNDNIDNFMSPGVYFQNYHAKIILKKGVYIAPNVGIITSNHDINNLENHNISADIIVGEGTWIGMNSVILPGATIGDKCIVGAGSVVTRSFKEPGKVIVGNPAKVIKNIDCLS